MILKQQKFVPTTRHYFSHKRFCVKNMWTVSRKCRIWYFL